MSIEHLIKTMMQEFREIVKTETVVGEPVTIEDTVIVPVTKISFGFAAGGGGGKPGRAGDGGSKTGGGGSVEPVAFIVIKNGKAQLIPLEEKGVSVSQLLKYLPDVMNKVRDFKEKREQKKAQKDQDESRKDPRKEAEK